MKRRRPDPDQGLFRFVWQAPADHRADGPEDDEPDDEFDPGPPPLRARVRGRHGLRSMALWGTAVRVRRAPAMPPGAS